MKSLLTLFLFLLSASARAQTYGTTALPCAASSYWNTKIKDGAIRYVPVNTKSTGESLGQWLISWRDRHMFVHVSQPGDPATIVKHRTFPSGGQNVCQDNRVYVNDWPNTFTLKIPTTVNVGYINDDNPVLFIDATEGLLDSLYFERCFDAPNDPAFYFAPGKATSGGPTGERYAIDGACMPFRGGAGGSKLPHIGVIRVAEITSAVGVDIPHTLNGYIPANTMSADNGDGTLGRRWPAIATDACRPTCYIGTNSELEEGVLLSVPASFDCASLLTEPGKKICRAIRDYGLNIIESSGNTTTTKVWGVHIEADEASFGGAGGKTASASYSGVRSAYQIDIAAVSFVANCMNITSVASGATVTATRNFCTDMEVVGAQFVVIKNNAEQCPKGCKRPEIASCANVTPTTSTCLISSPDLALNTSLTACTALTITDSGTPRAISACSIAGATVSMTHAALTAGGVWRANYTEVGSGTARVRTVADSLTSTAYELISFANQVITGGGSGAGQLIAYAYTSPPALGVAADGDYTEWQNVPGASITIPVQGTCTNAADCSAVLKFLYDSTKVCWYADVSDATNVWDTPAARYQDDSTEIYFDRSGNGGTNADADNLQIYSDQAGTCAEINTAGHTFTCDFAFKTGGYRFEACMPSSTFAGAPFAAAQIPLLDVRTYDDDDGGTTVEAKLSSANRTSGGTWTGLTQLVLSSTSISLAVDNPAPGIIFGSVLPIGTTTASINLTTDEAATCNVDYEVTPGETAWDSTAGPTASGLTHQFNLTGLTSNTSYDFQLRCSDGVNITTDSLRSFMTQGVTVSIFKQSHFRMYHPGSPVGISQPADLATLAAEDTGAQVMRGGVVTERFQLTCDGGAADCTQIGAVPYCSMNGGAYTLVPDSCGASDICYWTALGGVANGQSLVTERLTSTYANLSGQAFTRQTIAIIGGQGSHNTETELVYYFQFPNNPTASTVDCRLHQDGGAVLAGGYQATPARITLVSPQWTKSGF